MATKGGGVIQQEGKSFADRLAIFSGGSKASSSSTKPLQKRNTISMTGGRFGGLAPGKPHFQQKKQTALATQATEPVHVHRQSSYAPETLHSKPLQQIQKPITIEKKIEKNELERSVTEKANNFSGEKLPTIKDNPFLKMDRNKAAVPSKPVPKRVNNLNKPAFLRNQQQQNDQTKEVESKPPQPPKAPILQSKSAQQSVQKPIEYSKKDEDQKQKKDLFKASTTPAFLQPKTTKYNTSDFKNQTEKPTVGKLNNNFLEKLKQNDESQKRRNQKQKKIQQQIEQMRKIKEVTVIGGEGSDDQKSDKSQNSFQGGKRPRAGTTTSIQKRNTQQFNDFKANLAARLGQMGLPRPAKNDDSDEDDDSKSSDDDKSSDDYQQQGSSQKATPIVLVKNLDEETNDEFEAQKKEDLQNKKKTNIFDQMENNDQSSKKAPDTNFLHNNQMSKPANRKSKKAALIFDSDDEDFD